MRDSQPSFAPKGIVLKVPSVRLYETRPGVAITQTTGSLDAQTKTGTVGLGTEVFGLGVGVAASKGQTAGTLNLSSATHLGKDEMTKIDDGELILATNSISFIGSQFSRSVNFEDLLSCQTSTNEILISSKSSDKNWLIAVDLDEAADYVGQVVDLLIDPVSSQNLDATGLQLLSSTRDKNISELKRLNTQLTEYRSKFAEIETQTSSTRF